MKTRVEDVMPKQETPGSDDRDGKLQAILRVHDKAAVPGNLSWASDCLTGVAEILNFVGASETGYTLDDMHNTMTGLYVVVAGAAKFVEREAERLSSVLKHEYADAERLSKRSGAPNEE
jgi:hypothetical protein